MRRRVCGTVPVVALPLAVAILLLSACGPQGPVQGSPEWLWAAAHDSYAAGDLDKTIDHLARIEQKGNNPFVQRARAWSMILQAGTAGAHLEMAQAYGDGWSAAGAQKSAFLRQKGEHLREAGRGAIHLVESYDTLVKEPLGQAVVLDFPFPKGSGAPVTEMDRVYKGIMLPEEQRLAAGEKEISRGVVRAVSSVLASADDSAGAQNALKAGRAEVPPARFLAATGAALDRLSAVFDRKGTDDLEKVKLLRERAADACRRALELKPDAATETALKKLQAAVEKALKAPPGRVRSVAR